MAGDHDAFADLARISIGRLFSAARLILRDDGRAEDATQEALVAAWRDLSALRDPDRFEAWLHRLLVRACYREARRGRRQWAIELEVRPAETTVPDPALDLSNRDQLERGFHRLDADQRIERQLVFSQPTQGTSSERLFVANADGSAPPARIGPDVDSAAPVFSPDGERIAFLLLAPEGATLAVMNDDGSNVGELASYPIIGGSMLHGGPAFSWSPDSSTLLVNAGPSEEDLDLYTVAVGNAAGARPEVRQITDTPLLEYGASWAPDGDRITYHRGPLDGFPAVVVSRPDGTDATVISGSAQMQWMSPIWSPDSTYVVATTRGPNSEILLMDPDGDRPPETIQPPAYEVANDFAPGGADVVSIQRVAP